MQNKFVIFFSLIFSIYYSYYLCDFKKIINVKNLYLKELSNLYEIFSSSKKISLLKVQKQLDKFAYIGMKLLLKILIFSLPYIILFALLLVFKEKNKYFIIIIPLIPYLILFIRNGKEK